MNLSGIIDRGALFFAEKTALIFGGAHYTCGRFKRSSDQACAHFRETGVRNEGPHPWGPDTCATGSRFDHALQTHPG